MRSAFKPFSSVAALESLDQPTIAAYYKCDEASGSLIDSSTAAKNITSGTGAGDAAGLFALEASGARTFNGALYLAGSASLLDTWANLDDASITMLFSPDVVTGTQTVFDYGDGTNQFFTVQVLSTGEMRVHHPAGTLDVASGIVAGGRYLLQATLRRVNTLDYRLQVITVDLDDPDADIVYAETSDTTLASKATASGELVTVGAHYNGSTRVDEFDGTLDELILWNVPLDMFSFRDLALNYSGTYDEDDLFEGGNASHHLKVEIQDEDGVMQDYTNLEGQDYVVSFECGQDVDSIAMDATIHLRRQFYNKTLAHNMTTSPLYGTGNKVALTRKVRVYSATTPSDVVPTNRDFLGLWEGTIDALSWGDEVMELKCRGKYAALDDAHIEPDAVQEYGSSGGIDAEVEMQAIIDDNDPHRAGVTPAGSYYIGEELPLVYTPTTPGFALKPWGQVIKPVGTAIQDIAGLNGYRLAYWFDNNTRKLRLTYAVPERAPGSTMRTFSADNYLSVDSCAVNIDMIRNVISVGIHDGTGNEAQDDPRQYYEKYDATSITNYGRRWARIAEATTSQLDDSTEANALADAILADLKEPLAEVVVTLPFLRQVQVNDYYGFSANGAHFDADTDMAVYGFTHAFAEDGTAITTLMLRGVPAARVSGWGDQIVTIGTFGPNPLPELPPAAPTAAPTIDTFHPDFFHVTWDRPIGRRNRGQDLTEVHHGATSGFTANSTSLRGVTRADHMFFQQRYLDYPQTRYVKIIHRDIFGNVTAQSSQGAATPRAAGEAVGFEAYLSGDQTTGLTIKTLSTVTWDAEVNDNADGFASNKYVIPVDGLWQFDASIPFSWTGSTSAGLQYCIVELQIDVGGVGTWLPLAQAMEYVSPSRGVPLVVNLSKQKWLSANDEVRIQVYMDGNSATMTSLTILGGTGIDKARFNGLLVSQD